MNYKLTVTRSKNCDLNGGLVFSQVISGFYAAKVRIKP